MLPSTLAVMLQNFQPQGAFLPFRARGQTQKQHRRHLKHWVNSTSVLSSIFTKKKNKKNRKFQQTNASRNRNSLPQFPSSPWFKNRQQRRRARRDAMHYKGGNFGAGFGNGGRYVHEPIQLVMLSCRERGKGNVSGTQREQVVVALTREDSREHIRWSVGAARIVSPLKNPEALSQNSQNRHWKWENLVGAAQQVSAAPQCTPWCLGLKYWGCCYGLKEENALNYETVSEWLGGVVVYLRLPLGTTLRLKETADWMWIAAAFVAPCHCR